MQIDLSDEQYRKLAALIFLGEWIVNGGEKEPDDRKELQSAADFFYSLAPQFAVADWIGLCPDCGNVHANQTMEDALLPMMDEYDENTFWDVLAHHMAFRDLSVTSGVSDTDRELPKEMEMRLWRRKEQYDQEFQKHGLNHVRIVLHGGKSGR
ncbi:MAG: hypothetical protein OWU32_11690 [Firmicutes bacterium]|nr:hypothetical protein [Bacillota bacterium]